MPRSKGLNRFWLIFGDELSRLRGSQSWPCSLVYCFICHSFATSLSWTHNLHVAYWFLKVWWNWSFQGQGQVSSLFLIYWPVAKLVPTWLLFLKNRMSSSKPSMRLIRNTCVTDSWASFFLGWKKLVLELRTGWPSLSSLISSSSSANLLLWLLHCYLHWMNRFNTLNLQRSSYHIVLWTVEKSRLSFLIQKM